MADWASRRTPALTTDRTADVVQRIASCESTTCNIYFKPGRVYSLPCVRNAVASEDVSSTSVQMVDDMLHALAESVLYFEALDTNVGRRKATADRNGTRSPAHVVPRVLPAVHGVRRAD